MWYCHKKCEAYHNVYLFSGSWTRKHNAWSPHFFTNSQWSSFIFMAPKFHGDRNTWKYIFLRLTNLGCNGRQHQFYWLRLHQRWQQLGGHSAFFYTIANKIKHAGNLKLRMLNNLGVCWLQSHLFSSMIHFLFASLTLGQGTGIVAADVHWPKPHKCPRRRKNGWVCSIWFLVISTFQGVFHLL